MLFHVFSICRGSCHNCVIILLLPTVCPGQKEVFQIEQNGKTYHVTACSNGVYIFGGGLRTLQSIL